MKEMDYPVQDPVEALIYWISIASIVPTITKKFLIWLIRKSDGLTNPVRVVVTFGAFGDLETYWQIIHGIHYCLSGNVDVRLDIFIPAMGRNMVLDFGVEPHEDGRFGGKGHWVGLHDARFVDKPRTSSLILLNLEEIEQVELYER